MNAVSKLLIVMQMVLSIVFMAFAAAVYTTSNNWKAQAAKNAGDAKNNRDLYDQQFNKVAELKEQQKTIETDLKQKYEDELANAKNLEGQVAAARLDLAEERKRRAEATTEAQIATAEAEARRAEADTYRREVRKLRKDKDSLVVEGRSKDDQILELRRRMAQATDKDKRNLATIARQFALLRQNGVDPNAQVDANGQQLEAGREPVELVNGVVRSTKRSRSGASEFIYISLGSDDAVAVGNRLHVYRDKKFVADIILREVTSDGAVGVVDENLRNGTIKRGDNVTSKL